MKEQMNVPMLRFSEFNNLHSLNNFGKLVSDVTYGPRFSAEDYSNIGNVRTIRGTDMGLDGEVKYQQVPTATLDETIVKRHELKDGDLIMITTADCGVTSVYRQQNIKHICSAYAVKISLKEKADSTYFKYFFQTQKAQYEVSRFIRRATVSNLPASDIKRVRNYAPELQEQQKIAAFLSKVDEKISLLREKKSKLTEYKKGVMQQLFNGKWQQQDGKLVFIPPTLRFKADDGCEFPDWDEKKLGDVGSVVSGLTYSPENIAEQGTLVLRSSNIQSDQLSFQDNVYVSADRFNPVKEGDILICVRNGSKNLIGKNTLITAQAEGMAFGAFMAVYRSKYSYYLQHYFKTDAYKRNVHRNLGATINSINGSDLKKFKVSMPSIAEQNKIAAFLSSLDMKIHHTISELEKTKQWKKGLLQQMFV
jgi:type I restriction enzyme S subunit